MQNVQALKALWHEVFGDDFQDIDRFFDTFYTPELTAVILDSDAPVAAAYAVPSGALVLPDGRRFGCAMIYAVATAPACRGRGYGAAVTEAAAELARRAGCPAVVLKPADSGLFDFYEKHTDFRPFFEVYETELTRGQLMSASPLSARLVTPAEYRRLRNSFLAGGTYVDMDDRGLGYQEALCASSGGGLFAMEYCGDDGGTCACAFAERVGDKLLVKELLLSEGCRPEEALASLAAATEAERFYLRTPKALPGVPGAARIMFGMMLSIDGVGLPETDQSAVWYGPAFD